MHLQGRCRLAGEHQPCTIHVEIVFLGSRIVYDHQHCAILQWVQECACSGASTCCRQYAQAKRSPSSCKRVTRAVSTKKCHCDQIAAAQLRSRRCNALACMWHRSEAHTQTCARMGSSQILPLVAIFKSETCTQHLWLCRTASEVSCAACGAMA